MTEQNAFFFFYILCSLLFSSWCRGKANLLDSLLGALVLSYTRRPLRKLNCK